MKYILDTNVCLGACRSQEQRARFRATLWPLLPATCLSAVVAYELSVNARDPLTRGLLHEFVQPMQRAGWLVTPTFDDWLEAADMVTAIGERESGGRSKLPALLNDILIALSARRSVARASRSASWKDEFLRVCQPNRSHRPSPCVPGKPWSILASGRGRLTV